MNYYNTWKSTKPLLALVPVVIFWVTSVIFFIVGLAFKNPIVLFGYDLTSYIAISLSLANTAIQIIGNDTEDLDFQLRVIWVTSYVLGIGTNVYGLLQVLSIQNPLIEWAVAVSLGLIIEISPEKLFVQFLRGLRNYNKPKENTSSKNSYKPQTLKLYEISIIPDHLNHLCSCLLQYGTSSRILFFSSDSSLITSAAMPFSCELHVKKYSASKASNFSSLDMLLEIIHSILSRMSLSVVVT